MSLSPFSLVVYTWFCTEEANQEFFDTATGRRMLSYMHPLRIQSWSIDLQSGNDECFIVVADSDVIECVFCV